jgi:hypothetical protein
LSASAKTSVAVHGAKWCSIPNSISDFALLTRRKKKKMFNKYLIDFIWHSRHHDRRHRRPLVNFRPDFLDSFSEKSNHAGERGNFKSALLLSGGALNFGCDLSPAAIAAHLNLSNERGCNLHA